MSIDCISFTTRQDIRTDGQNYNVTVGEPRQSAAGKPYILHDVYTHSGNRARDTQYIPPTHIIIVTVGLYPTHSEWYIPCPIVRKWVIYRHTAKSNT